MRKIVRTDEAPKAIGPYSQAVEAGGFVFASGQIPLDPSTQQFVEGDVAAQTEQVLLNLSKVLEGEVSDRILLYRAMSTSNPKLERS